MSNPATTTEFLDLVRQSGVIPEKQLAELPEGVGDPSQDPVRLAANLIKRGLLTNFQARLLLAGKFRGFRVGSYIVRDQLGQGGMGTVYLAEHETLRRRVALKVLAKAGAAGPAGVERFLREARAAAALDHPNIVRIFDVGQQGPTMRFLVMEYVDGQTLDQVLANGPLPCGRAAEVIVQAAAGLQHAYEKGFVHRDIKPANLILARDGTVKILDMGLARSFDTEDKLTERLEQGAILGTADFIAPEQAISSPNVDIRADIYSLGATFFALVTGKPPFEGNTTQKLMQHQMREVPPLNELDPTFPPQLAEVVAVMMAKRPEKRFQTPADVIAALSQWVPSSAQVVAGLSGTDLGKAGMSAAEGSKVTLSEMMTGRTRRITGRLPSQLRRKKLALIGGAVAAGVVVVVGGLIWALSGGDPEPAPRDDGPAVAATPEPTPQPTPPAIPHRKSPPAVPSPAFVPLSLEPVAQARSDDLLVPTAGRSVGTPGSTRNRLMFPDWGPKEFNGVPFRLIDPTVSANIIALYSANQPKTAELPKSVVLPVNASTAAVHVLGGISGWGWPCQKGSSGIGAPKDVASVIVRVRYADGMAEEFVWKNGEHLADYNGRREVPGSEHAFEIVYGHQVRYLAVRPTRDAVVREVEFAKAAEDEFTCPIVFAVTVEKRIGAEVGAATPATNVNVAEPAAAPGAFVADFTAVKPFRQTVRGGQPVGGGLFPAGVSAGCAKTEAVGEFRAEAADGGTALGLTNLSDARSARLTFDLVEAPTPSLRPGQEYKIAVEYRAADGASWVLSVRDRADEPRVKVSLDGTGGEWRTAELVFRQSADAPIAAVVENTAVGEEYTLFVRRFELVELK